MNKDVQTMTEKKLSRPAARRCAALLGALAVFGSAAAGAQQQHVEDARVISSTPIRTPDGQTSYSVTYEYGGRQYTTRTETPPGDYIQLQLSPMGVMAAQPASQGQAAPADDGNAPEAWRNVTPEPGVVLSGNSGGAVAPAPVYAQPPVVYPAPAPVYSAPAYGYYGSPYPAYPAYSAYPPIGLSLNFGYSSWRGGRGWH